MQNAADYHLGQVPPSRDDGAPLVLVRLRRSHCFQGNVWFGKEEVGLEVVTPASHRHCFFPSSHLKRLTVTQNWSKKSWVRTNVIVETKNISKPESQTQLFKKPSSNCYKRSSLRGSCCGTVVIAVRGAHFGAVAVAQCWWTSIINKRLRVRILLVQVFSSSLSIISVFVSKQVLLNVPQNGCLVGKLWVKLSFYACIWLKEKQIYCHWSIVKNCAAFKYDFYVRYL